MAIAPALVGALLGFLFGLFLQNFLALRAIDVRRIEDHVAEVGRIEELALDYWLQDGSDVAARESISAARLRGALAVTIAFEPTARRIFGNDFPKYESLDLDLFELATGGSFETVGRRADPQRAIDTAQACHTMRDLLRSQRRRIYWAH